MSAYLSKLYVAVSAFCVSSLGGASAQAFCRATDCVQSTEQECARSGEGCLFEGLPLGWVPAATVVVTVDTTGIETSGVPADDAFAATQTAVAACAATRCEKEAVPNINLAAVDSAPEALVQIVFRGEDWPYEPRAVAKTILEFNLDSGEIKSAKIEMNAASYTLALDPEAGEIDLVAVLTHEFGHVLGLDHSQVQGSTMEAEVTSGWSDELATLEQDDLDGVCSLYPPAAETEEVDVSDDVELKNEGGCSVAAPSRGSMWPAFAGLFGVALFATRRRRAV